MKIAVLIDELFRGGFQKVAVEEVRVLRRMGHDATLWVLRASQQGNCEDWVTDIPVKYIDSRFPVLLRLSFKFPFFSFFSWFHLSYALFTPLFYSLKDFDNIVAHGSYTCFTAITLRLIRRIKSVAFIHDPISYILPQAYTQHPVLKYWLGLLMPLAHLVDHFLIEMVDAVIVFPTMMSNIAALGQPRRILPLWNGCYPVANPITERENFALAVTRWDQRKNPFFLLDVWSRIKYKPTLIVAGSWKSPILKYQFEQKIHEYCLDDWVRVIDHVRDYELASLYQRARFLVHPVVEAYGMTIIEAASFGCPSIVPRQSGIATELRQLPQCGFFPEAGDLDGYVEIVNRLMGEDGWSLSLQAGQNAWVVAAQNSWENHVNAILRLLNSISH